MPKDFDSGFDAKIGSWKILYDPVQLRYIVYVDHKLVRVTDSMFDAYNVITDLILA